MMLKTLEKSGKTEEAAIAAALEELGLDRDDVSVEIVERAKSGFLGIGASPAVTACSMRRRMRKRSRRLRPPRRGRRPPSRRRAWSRRAGGRAGELCAHPHVRQRSA